MTDQCPFCRRIELDDVADATALSASFPDAYPISRGHTLVVPRRHASRLLELDAAETADLWECARRAAESLAESLDPDGFNLGLNDGAAAGQTVPHVHLHVVPRFSGDVPDPRGGVRWVIPDSAAYWSQ